MTFRSKSLIAAFLLAGALIIGFAAQASAASADKPNIVLILSDDQSWNDYGFMGHEHIKTPHLDKLASESVLFRRGYVPTALCRPSLMTLMTGQYAHKHGVTGNDPSPKYAERGSDLYNQRRAKLIANIDRFETVPEALGKRGYLSHQSGKYWEGNFTRGGFTHGMTRGFPQPGGRHGDDGLKIGREGMKPIADFVSMAAEKDKPFYLWYAPFLPHTPHNPPARLFNKYKDKVDSPHVARYYAMCEWFDESCGQLIDILEKNKVRDNTLIVYVTDNGWIQNPAKRGYDKRSKQTPYEGGIRTPIFFNWPGKLKPSDRPELVSSIDLVPTMLAAAGAKQPKNLPGLNLVPNLKTGAEIGRSHILGESFAHDIADIKKPEASLLFRWTIEGKWKLLLTYDGEVNRYKTTHPRTEKRPQLFDLLADPWEKKNLASENPDVVARLAGRIADWYPVSERRVDATWE
ncbi:MAG: sulfatase family protein [Verrucomicrobiia bacterium]|jgi:arylsulfatase A-like enzyme